MLWSGKSHRGEMAPKTRTKRYGRRPVVVVVLGAMVILARGFRQRLARSWLFFARTVTAAQVPSSAAPASDRRLRPTSVTAPTAAAAAAAAVAQRVHGYEVPFVAHLNTVHLASGYSEWIANHTSYTVGKPPFTKTYTLYPWGSTVTGVTGWVSGYLQLPSLTAPVPASNIEFCQAGGSPGPDVMLQPHPDARRVHLRRAERVRHPPARGAAGADDDQHPARTGDGHRPNSLNPGQSRVHLHDARSHPPRRHRRLLLRPTARVRWPAGTVYYNGYPSDAYPGQFIKISGVKINGQAGRRGSRTHAHPWFDLHGDGAR